MKPKNKKIDARNVIEEALNAKAEKRNITYRIDVVLLDRFNNALKNQEVSGNQVVEILIRDFVESWEQNKRR